jgi:hypothetical protein
MSSSPKRNLSDSPAISAATTPVSEHPNLPLLYKVNDESNSMIAHVDENNENEAV